MRQVKRYGHDIDMQGNRIYNFLTDSILFENDIKLVPESSEDSFTIKVYRGDTYLGNLTTSPGTGNSNTLNRVIGDGEAVIFELPNPFANNVNVSVFARNLFTGVPLYPIVKVTEELIRVEFLNVYEENSILLTIGV